MGNIYSIFVDIYLLENEYLYQTVRRHIQNAVMFKLKCNMVVLNIVLW